jgi:hypothetical protein
MRRLSILMVMVALGFGSLLPSGVAAASAPSLLRVGQQQRHPIADFVAPGADDATIYFATKPDRATDGRFLDENVKDLDILTADELQSGHWTDSSQLDPGTYFVMLRASDTDCILDPNCLNGFSQVLTLSVPAPRQRFAASVKTFRFLSSVDLSLKVTPLGEALPYQVCWRRTRGGRKCVRGTVNGFSWNDSASDTLSLRKQGMPRRTTFTWYVHGRKVASKRVGIAT